MKQEEMRSLLDVSVEAVEYVQGVLARGEEDSAIAEIMDHLRRIAEALEAEYSGATGLLQKVYLYARNIQASVDELRCDPSLFTRIFSLEIRPFVLEMNRLWRLDADVLSDARQWRAHQQELMQSMTALHQAPRKNYPYEVSIILLAYNKLEYTKAAVESLFAHTDFSDGRVELITINNGSDDGTREYFERLPHTKKVNLKYNVLAINAQQYIVEGRYVVGFSNDVIATPHWLEHLLAAMESDRRIACAVPTCNEGGISNDQGIPVSYPNTFEGVEPMQAFAAAHNHLNPALWENRCLLMPFLSIIRTDICRMGGIDPIYTRAEFVDDDLSTLLRRTGWRQLLLKDTFMHHFGGVTLGEGRRKVAGNALDEMRRVYYKKWGVDAWDGRGGFPGAEVMEQWHTPSANERVLVLEPRFGDFACELFNSYRRGGFVPHMTAAVFDERYLPDTGYLFDETLTATRVEEVAAQSEGGYNIIAAGCYLDELPLGDVIADLEQLYGLLTPGGMLVLPVRNPGSAYELDCIMNEGTRDVYCLENEVKRYSNFSYRHLLRALHAHPYLHRYRVHSIMMQGDDVLAERMKPLLRSSEGAPSDLELSLSVRMFFLGIRRES